MATTTQRGYGWSHQQRRKRLLARHVDGSPCPFHGVDPKCPGPMYRWQRLQLDHSTPRVLGGTVGDRLAHGPCNERAGQRLGITRRRSTGERAPATPSGPTYTSSRW